MILLSLPDMTSSPYASPELANLAHRASVAEQVAVLLPSISVVRGMDAIPVDADLPVQAAAVVRARNGGEGSLAVMSVMGLLVMVEVIVMVLVVMVMVVV